MPQAVEIVQVAGEPDLDSDVDEESDSNSEEE